MQELTIKVQDDFLPDFFKILKQMPQDKVEFKKPVDEIKELIERIDAGLEVLTPLEWDEFDEVIENAKNASH
ncbi:hypothetical protein BKH41_03870 [Helicobacter sp. 12S02232-10]|uniref:hypothetical protein n=1 Tax=Helicobacter sp. 12S02232-10 TaxID=1476197 RepID=UPI000BA6572A|nr:hypothetical protein [Helicobacter sp. 12S02232-10]PAF49226.1 hypothetical protein BKH41_03870 [Helicobacter sp. 12S02232-10]